MRCYVVLLLACGAAVCGACASARARPSPAAARAGIEAALVRFDSVSRAGDARGNAALFTEDAVVSLGTLADIRGRPALLSIMQGYYERNVVQAHQLRAAELEVYGDTAYARGTYLYIAGPRGQSPATERGRFAAVWLRGTDGLWRMHRYLENLLPSAAGP